MISLILVSHSKKITDGLKEMIDEMAANQENVTTFSVGGTSDGRLGTDPVEIYNTIVKRQQDDAIVIFADLGSAVLSSETAIDLLDDELKSKVTLADCPLVEGAFIAAVQINSTTDIKTLLTEIETI